VILHILYLQGGEDHMPNNNNLLVPGVEQALDQMKIEIASEFGVNLGAETTSRANGSVGGEITKRLVQTAQQQLSGGFPQ
jgi:hypothetical protein